MPQRAQYPGNGTSIRLEHQGHQAGLFQRNEGEAYGGHDDQREKTKRLKKKGRNLFVGNDNAAASGKK